MLTVNSDSNLCKAYPFRGANTTVSCLNPRFQPTNPISHHQSKMKARLTLKRSMKSTNIADHFRYRIKLVAHPSSPFG